VKYAHLKPSPGKIGYYSSDRTPINLSVIIPTIDSYRGGYLPKLLAQIDDQDFKGFEVIVLRGDPRQGRAINIAAALSKGKYILTLDDDTSLPDKKTFSKLVSIMEEHPKIGIAGGNNVISTDCNNLARLVMKQIPRRSWKPVTKIADFKRLRSIFAGRVPQN
jgi:glycosyltransferase involved in cell wall biosynthesis